MTEKENAAVQKASLCYSINMLRLLLSMRLITTGVHIHPATMARIKKKDITFFADHNARL